MAYQVSVKLITPSCIKVEQCRPQIKEDTTNKRGNESETTTSPTVRSLRKVQRFTTVAYVQTA